MLRQRHQTSSPPPTLSDTLQSAEEKVKKSLLVLWDDLPSWRQDNSHILGSYRPSSSSFSGSFASLFYLHNESVNVYSHLLGALFFSICSIILYNMFEPRYPSASKDDVLAFACFFGGAAACLGISGTYHLCSNHSYQVARLGNKLDYVGIVFLICGSFVPSIFYGFCGHEELQRTYWAMILTLGVGCTAVSIFDRFRTPAWRPYRAAMFVAFGLSAVIPVLHGIELHGFAQMQKSIGLNYVLLQGFLYILGAGIYAARWPERSWPGAFDIWGSSHQIFHMLVLAAAGTHLIGLIKAFDYHHSASGGGC